ncbi:MAG: chorismate synthase [Bacteroidetes bacterium]|nr:chorismate synthase [Bacteroidota bacterium]
MAGNTFGTRFKLTTFGESHGTAIGGIIDGCPAGLEIDTAFIQVEMERRRPGHDKISSARKEMDQVEFLSGFFEGKTTGTPIGFMIRNQDQKSTDYNHIKDTYRPSHADYTYDQKYGIRDYRGGGRASARETACRVAAGAIAKLLLGKANMEIYSFVSQIGAIQLKQIPDILDPKDVESSPVRCPDKKTSRDMVKLIEKTRSEGDTLGGIITCVIRHAPAGLGEPVFDKLEAELAKAMLSINAVKGFEIGSGFQSAAMKGSEHNDIFTNTEGQTSTLTNFSGGVQGGISNGMDIIFRVAFKPVATLMSDQVSVDRSGKQITLQGKGRHDVCVVPRAVPIVEAMAALVIADLYLRNMGAKISQ